ncbi:hypothetical protein [Chondromyces apiculatus]|uniref:Postacrosomal sheath WW domain-binding protein n=1 Tax=Chondromyces apiculatus DSM 436 TaxID=1192034 RepID=A0A017TI81_9BACT|nr:hypothetical protein [Chondromyces apiculatus]EYF08572.1 Postacrosomal sheath WW domain-binding protein [Chondromyces apiculatus DSM 436]
MTMLTTNTTHFPRTCVRLAASAMLGAALLAPATARAQERPADAASAPDPQAPPPGYGAPPPGYGAPPPGYGAPPPGYGTPPPGYYGQQPPPAYYGQPGAGKAAEGPKSIDYEEGMAIPEGYTLQTRMRRGLVIGGAVTFGTMYMISALIASVGDSAGTDELLPLYAPLAGPFISLGMIHSSASRNDRLGGVSFLMVMDGLAQIGGMAMLIGGIAAPKTVLMRNDVATLDVNVTPMPMGLGGMGLGVWGSM